MVGSCLLGAARSVAGCNDTCFFDHEDGAPNGHDGSVQHASRDRERLARAELDRLRSFQLDLEAPIQHEEELVLPVVLVPVELTLHHAQADKDVSYLHQGLVVPRVVDFVDQGCTSIV
jgi:hypothetical protein